MKKIIAGNNQDELDTHMDKWAREDRKRFHAVQAGRAKHKHNMSQKRIRQEQWR